MKKQHIVLGMIALGVLGCSQDQISENEDANDRTFRVKVMETETYDGTLELSYSGVVEAQQRTPLSFANMGTVIEVLVDEGETISKGQLLARLNTSNAQNAYELALKKQEQATDAYDRMKPMKENGTLPEIKWVEIETGVAQAGNSVAIAKKTLDDCNLYSPVSGVVGVKAVTPGMNVMPGVSAFEILDISKVHVKVPVSENEVVLIKKGEAATVTIGALDRTVTGKIKEIGVAADILSHTYPIKIEIDNADGRIRPGMICSVQATSQKEASGMLISNKALQQDLQGNQFVYVAENGKAKKREVNTISVLENRVLVSGGLKLGDAVVTAGQEKLRSGSSINIIN
jgi:RND family efflux transporter MFP subunit